MDDDSTTSAASRDAPLDHIGLPGSFEAMYRREFPRLVRLAYSLSGSRLVAEDLAQDALIAAHRQWDRVGRLDRPGAWVRRVVIRKSASQYQRRKAELRAIARLGPIRGVLPGKLDSESAHIWRAVRSLPRRQAEAVALFYVDDLSVESIAEVMECAPATVRVHLHRARQTLAETLDPTGEH